MKLNEVKQQVFHLTCTQNIKQLRRQHPHLTQNSDFRYKSNWLRVLEQLKEHRATDNDLSLLDLEQSELMLKESLFNVGKMAGISDKSLEIDWQRIQLNSLITDIHIEEL
jgi:hypothetical protein